MFSIEKRLLCPFVCYFSILLFKLISLVDVKFSYLQHSLIRWMCATPVVKAESDVALSVTINKPTVAIFLFSFWSSSFSFLSKAGQSTSIIGLGIIDGFQDSIFFLMISIFKYKTEWSFFPLFFCLLFLFFLFFFTGGSTKIRYCYRQKYTKIPFTKL